MKPGPPVESALITRPYCPHISLHLRENNLISTSLVTSEWYLCTIYINKSQSKTYLYCYNFLLIQKIIMTLVMFCHDCHIYNSNTKKVLLYTIVIILYLQANICVCSRKMEAYLPWLLLWAYYKLVCHNENTSIRFNNIFTHIENFYKFESW